ncbi:hypothetical protein GYA19_01975 [Candidatus Beckwithbacteria bacterium]|nr:hypothetical protein [Candidatus Beckwithbacteria bacterium]
MSLPKSKLLIILIIVTILIIALNIGMAIFKNQKSIEEGSLPATNIKPNIENLNLKYQYKGELSEVSKTATVYNIAKQQVLTPNLAQEIAQSLGFTEPAEGLDDISGTVYLFKKNDGNTTLTIYPNPLKIKYSDYSQTQGEPVEQKTIISLAQDFLTKNNFIEKPFALSKPYFEYKAVDFQGILIDPETSQDIKYAKISYNLDLEETPIVDQNSQTYPIEITSRLDGTILKAEITFIPNEIIKIGTADLAPAKDALDAINNGTGSIVKLNNPKIAYTQIDNQDITTATLYSLELIYVYDYDNQILAPFYRFSGVGNNKNGDVLEIEVLINALPQEYFKK